MPLGFWAGPFLCLAIVVCGLPATSTALAADEQGALGSDNYCTIGQDWPGFNPEWIEPETITGGGESFFARVDPGEHCACPLAFGAVTIDVFLTMADESPLPFTIAASMGLKEALADSGGAIPWLPGATICETPVREFTYHVPKDFVGFGIALGCDCAPMEGPYFLFFTIHSVMDPPGGFYTAGGGAPELGRFLALVDDQWVDLVAEGILTRGDLVISASARCCETPVAVSERSWGSIKAFFR